MDYAYSHFLDLSNNIKLWGSINDKSSEETELGSSYSLSITDGITMDLYESNFVVSMGISFAKEHTSYKLTLSKINNTYLKSEKHTDERYGMVYQIEPDEIITIAEEYLNKVNLSSVIENKLLSCLHNTLERIIPDILINGHYGYRFTVYYPNMTAHERQRYEEETKTYRITRYSWELNELKRTLERIRVHKLLLSFIPYDQDLVNYGLPSIDRISDLLISSDIFKQKNKHLKKVFSGELIIEKRENKLYLGFC